MTPQAPALQQPTIDRRRRIEPCITGHMEHGQEDQVVIRRVARVDRNRGRTVGDIGEEIVALVYERLLITAVYELPTEVESNVRRAIELLSWLMVSSRVASELS